ncbi:PREDICTED: DDB1- and CUL4-associated factor 4 isoform X2 [Ipomoea nil]|nr:PREDICTED: DDB1- and CUL4-associated factor 4 isoform X2 [Ipomoea nil]
MVDNALEQMSVGVDRLEGTVETDILLTGNVNGSLCIFEVGKVGEEFDHGSKLLPDRVWPSNAGNSVGCIESPGLAWRYPGAILNMPSTISCIKMCQKLHQPVETASSSRALITTLGSEGSGGTVYILDLSEQLDLNSHSPILRRLSKITSFDYTVWTADCNFDGSRAVIGTNTGAALVNIDTGTKSWICRCKSDVFSLQLDQSGNTILCGLRNGAILSIDARQRPENFSSRLPRHQIPYHTHEASSGRAKKFHQERFELKGNMCRSDTIFMPSSISCIASLALYDQYFLASSMDGSIKLYDNRLIQRGAVQSYEGNVNSHTRIQLGVDPSESIVMSGGEDCYVRLWSIKSGEMLFRNKFMNAIPSVVCWPRTGGIHGLQNTTRGAWLGSQDGLFHIGWPV